MCNTCCNSCNYIDKSCYSCKSPGNTNFAVLFNSQKVPNLQKVDLSGSSYQNNITLTPPYTVNFCSPGMYKIDFVISSASTQPGPLSFRFMVSANGDNLFGEYSAGLVNSTIQGLQVSGTGFVEITKTPTTGYLQNTSGQLVDISYLRLNIVKIS